MKANVESSCRKTHYRLVVFLLASLILGSCQKDEIAIPNTVEHETSFYSNDTSERHEETKSGKRLIQNRIDSIIVEKHRRPVDKSGTEEQQKVGSIRLGQEFDVETNGKTTEIEDVSQFEENSSILASLERTGCLGNCPVYVLEIDTDGVLRFEGRKNVGYIGTRTDILTENEHKRLSKAFVDTQFEKLESTYDERILDAPFTIIHYQGKSVRSRGNAPTNFVKIVDFLEELVRVRGWLNSGPQTREVILELCGHSAAQLHEKEDFFYDHDLRLIKRVGPSSSLYLFSVSVDQGQGDAFLRYLLTHPFIKNAQWNHRLKKRG